MMIQKYKQKNKMNLNLIKLLLVLMEMDLYTFGEKLLKIGMAKLFNFLQDKVSILKKDSHLIGKSPSKVFKLTLSMD
jgi:hypothetical protein